MLQEFPCLKYLACHRQSAAFVEIRRFKGVKEQVTNVPLSSAVTLARAGWFHSLSAELFSSLQQNVPEFY